MFVAQQKIGAVTQFLQSREMQKQLGYVQQSDEVWRFSPAFLLLVARTDAWRWFPSSRFKPGVGGACGPREHLIWPGSEFSLPKLEYKHRVKTKLHDEQVLR